MDIERKSVNKCKWRVARQRGGRGEGGGGEEARDALLLSGSRREDLASASWCCGRLKDFATAQISGPCGCRSQGHRADDPSHVTAPEPNFYVLKEPISPK